MGQYGTVQVLTIRLPFAGLQTLHGLLRLLPRDAKTPGAAGYSGQSYANGFNPNAAHGMLHWLDAAWVSKYKTDFIRNNQVA